MARDADPEERNATPLKHRVDELLQRRANTPSRPWRVLEVVGILGGASACIRLKSLYGIQSQCIHETRVLTAQGSCRNLLLAVYAVAIFFVLGVLARTVRGLAQLVVWWRARALQNKSATATVAPSPRMRAHWLPAVLCLLSAALIAVVGTAWCSQSVVECNGSFTAVPLPADWRAWPETQIGGGRESPDAPMFQGNALWKMSSGPYAWRDAYLRFANTCPRSGISLDAWFDGGRRMGTHPHDIHVRAKDGVLVVTASNYVPTTTPAATSPDEVVIGAFRSETTFRHPAFVDRVDALDAFAVTAAVCALLLACVGAARASKRARAYGNASLFREGIRGADGTIRFADDTPPVAPVEGLARPGPVLVRLGARIEGFYRSSTRSTADDFVEASREEAVKSTLANARTTLWRTVGMTPTLLVFYVVARVIVVISLSAPGR